MPSKISDDKSIRETSRLGLSCTQRYRVMVSVQIIFFELPSAENIRSPKTLLLTMDAPQQHNQPSRKGKKAWRKNVDVSEVDLGLEVARKEIIAGWVKLFACSTL